MNLEVIYLKPNTEFSSYVTAWAAEFGIPTEDYDLKSEEYPDGLVVVNANQDIEKETHELRTAYDKKHIPTQKIDINGTLQVALNGFEMWLNNFKCSNVLMLGSDDLLKNDNLDRFFHSIKK